MSARGDTNRRDPLEVPRSATVQTKERFSAATLRKKAEFPNFHPNEHVQFSSHSSLCICNQRRRKKRRKRGKKKEKEGKKEGKKEGRKKEGKRKEEGKKEKKEKKKRNPPDKPVQFLAHHFRFALLREPDNTKKHPLFSLNEIEKEKRKKKKKKQKHKNEI